jgi:MFS family permease
VLGSVDLAWPYLTRAGLLAGAFVLAFRMMHDIGFTPKTTRMADLPAAMKGVLRASVSYGWKVRSVRTLMLVSFVQMGFLTWGFYAWQPYFLELLSRDAVWVGGVVAALIALSTIAGNALVAFFTRFCGRRTTLMLCSALVLSLACVGVGLVSSFAFALMLLLLATGAMGVTGPVKQAYLHAVIPSEHRATVVSFDSLVGSAGGIGGQVGLGYVARSNGIAAGYVTGGLALLVGLPVLGMLRRFGDPADVIVGRKAGSRGACAAQGLPEVASVDTAVRQPAAVS